MCAFFKDLSLSSSTKPTKFCETQKIHIYSYSYVVPLKVCNVAMAHNEQNIKCLQQTQKNIVIKAKENKIFNLLILKTLS